VNCQQKEVATSYNLLTGYSDCWNLEPGPSLITFLEAVDIPDNLMAYFLPRSTLLLRSAVISGAVWGPRFKRIGQALITVHHLVGIRLERFALVGRLVFDRLDQQTEHVYAGSYERFERDPSIIL